MLSGPFSSALGGSIVGTFLGLGSEGPNCNGGTKAQRDTPGIQESRRCDSGSVRERAYSYQQIAKEFEVHFTTVGRIVRQPKKRVSVITGKKVADGPSCAVMIDLTLWISPPTVEDGCSL